MKTDPEVLLHSDFETPFTAPDQSCSISILEYPFIVKLKIAIQIYK